MQLTAAAVTPPAEHAARRPAGAADAAAADADVRLMAMDRKGGAVKIMLLIIAVLGLQSECAAAEESWFPPPAISIGYEVTAISSLICSAAGAGLLLGGHPSKKWGFAGIVSGAGLFVCGALAASSIDAEMAFAVASLSVAGVTTLVGILNVNGARGRDESSGRGMSMVVGMRPDSPKGAQPAVEIAWRF